MVKVADIAGVGRGQSMTKDRAISGPYPVVGNSPKTLYMHNEYNREGVRW